MTMTRARRLLRRRWGTKLAVVLGLLAGGGLGSVLAWAFFSAVAPSATATVTAGSLPQGSTPTASPTASSNSAQTITVTFSVVDASNNTEVTTYNVTRYNAYTDTSAGAISGSCSVTGSVSCTDSPGVGSWSYTDTPTSGGWTGQASAQSNAVYISSATGLSPTSGIEGSSASINAQGFFANHSLSVTVGGVSASITSGGTTGSGGSSTVGFNIPSSLLDGSYAVVVSDGTNSATSPTNFTVTSTAPSASGPAVTATHTYGTNPIWTDGQDVAFTDSPTQSAGATVTSVAYYYCATSNAGCTDSSLTNWTLIGTSTGGGSWSQGWMVALNGSMDGTYYVVAVATNNDSQSSTLSPETEVGIDTTPPAVSTPSVNGYS